jgi:hypothetical protein
MPVFDVCLVVSRHCSGPEGKSDRVLSFESGEA